MPRSILALLVTLMAGPFGAAAIAGSDLVTGVALVTRSAGVEQRWGFTARGDQAGAEGQLELATEAPAGGAGQLRGAVVCAAADQATGTARVAALVEQSTVPPASVGAFLIWTVVDRGEGAGDTPDLVSELVPVSDRAIATDHCAVGLLPLAAVERGDIRVRK